MRAKAIFMLFLSLCFGIAKMSADSECNKFVISGYRCVIVPSDKYKIKISHPEWSKQHIEGEILHIELIDATGKMPKDTLFLYTNDIKKLVLNFSTLEMPQTFKADTMQLSLAAGSRGKAQITANQLNLNIGSASKLTLSGDIQNLIGKVEGNSHLKAEELKVANSAVKVTGNSSADIQTIPFTTEKKEPSSSFSYILFIIVLIILILFAIYHRKKKKTISLHTHKETYIENEIMQFKETSLFTTLINKEPEIDAEYMPILEQKDLYEKLNDAFPKLTTKLQEAYPGMNREDLYFCILSVLKFKNRTIAYCLRTTTGALRTRKNRIKKDMVENIFQQIFNRE